LKPINYLTEIYNTLPRLLALIDRDETSNSYGMGDRYYWAWGLIDFGNASYQGAANGISRLWKSGLWPYQTDKDIFLKRIDSLFIGAGKLTRRDGSLEEAFPNEGSYCVTSLVAYDLLSAIDHLSDEVDAEIMKKWVNIISPMIEFLIVSDETHALISNHLATAVAALVRWNKINPSEIVVAKATSLLERILENQDQEEGWFKEYEGADPGYQSLCTYYLADIYQIDKSFELLEPLRKSIKFLSHFAHPDGSFGGLYGSRCTRFYFPAGIEALRIEIPEAAALADFMYESIEKQTVCTLNVMDESNLIPMFNCYCWSAALKMKNPTSVSSDLLLPFDNSFGHKYFERAGLFLDCGVSHYTIINFYKGGTVYHFKNKQLVLVNGGVLVQNKKGKLGSSQLFSKKSKIEFSETDKIIVQSAVSPMPKKLPSVLEYIILRIMCISVFKISYLRELVKKILVYLLITRKKEWPVSNIRSFVLGQDLSYNDSISYQNKYRIITTPNYFVAIHMASQGYWQKQDEII
jgi:hypothetical protein